MLSKEDLQFRHFRWCCFCDTANCLCQAFYLYFIFSIILILHVADICPLVFNLSSVWCTINYRQIEVLLHISSIYLCRLLSWNNTSLELNKQIHVRSVREFKGECIRQFSFHSNNYSTPATWHWIRKCGIRGVCKETLSVLMLCALSLNCRRPFSYHSRKKTKNKKTETNKNKKWYKLRKLY